MIKPLKDRIVISIQQPEAKSLGGIVLPATAQEAPQTGKVVAVGPELYTTTLDGSVAIPSGIQVGVSVGDTVLFVKYSGTDVEDEGKQYKVLKIADVLGVIE